jgi:hypothetical protein
LIGANGADSFELDLTKGLYLVSFSVEQPDAVSAAIGDPLDQLTYSGDFHLTLAAVPEPSTWTMMLLGFAGFGYAGFWRVRGWLAPPASPNLPSPGMAFGKAGHALVGFRTGIRVRSSPTGGAPGKPRAFCIAPFK